MDNGSGSSATDTSGNNQTGTLTNGAAFNASGRFAGSVTLDGTNDYIDCQAIGATNGTSALTVAFWLNATVLGDYDILCAKYTSTNYLFSIQLSAAGGQGPDDLEVVIDNGSAYHGVYTTGNHLSTGTWIHVAVVYDGNQSVNADRCKIYINGQLVGRTPFGTIPATLLSNSVDWLVGWREDFQGGTSFNGKIDEFYLYTRALSASDVLELYNWTSVGIFSSDFNGLTSKIENTTGLVLDPADTEVTICAWVYPVSSGESGAGVIAAIDEAGSRMSIQHGSGSNFAFIAQWSVQDGKWTFPLSSNTWSAVAVSYDRSDDTNNPVGRVNFANATRNEVTEPDGTAVTSGAGYSVGNVSDQTRTWNGRIAHVQIFNRVLSAAEMDAALTAPGSVKRGLRVWLPMTNESDTNDRSGNSFHGTKTDLTTATDSPVYDSLFQFGAVNETIGQIVIPSNGAEPAIGVRGLGARSKLTASNLLSNGTRFVTTKGWGTSPSTVIEPSVSNLYLDGNQGIPDHSYNNNDEKNIANEVCDAIDIDGDAAEVTGCKIFDFRGDAITVRNNSTEYSYLVRMPRVRDNKISHCWTGIRAQAVDTQISGNRVANCRDYGLFVPQNVGSVQSDGNHFFGLQKAIVVTNAEAFRSTNDVFSDAGYGMHLTGYSHYATVTGGFTQHCWIRNIDVESSYNSFLNCTVRVAESDDDHPGIVGVEFASRGNQFIGGSVYTS